MKPLNAGTWLVITGTLLLAVDRALGSWPTVIIAVDAIIKRVSPQCISCFIAYLSISAKELYQLIRFYASHRPGAIIFSSRHIMDSVSRDKGNLSL
jgi:hypothetical protein